MCSVSEWGWCPGKRLISAESWGGAFWPLPLAVRALGGVLIPGKAVPQPADVGCLCQVNEIFIKVTAGYFVL